LSPMLFNFGLRYTIRKFQETQEVLELNGPHQFLVCAADTNLLSESRNTTKKTQKFYLPLVARLV
jgi:hypothetical protein